MNIRTGTACPRHGTHGAMSILFFVHLRSGFPATLAEEMPEDELRSRLPEFSTCIGCRNTIKLFLRGACTVSFREPTEEERAEMRATEEELRGKEHLARVEYVFIQGLDHAGLPMWDAVMPTLKVTGTTLYWNGRRYTLQRPPEMPAESR